MGAVQRAGFTGIKPLGQIIGVPQVQIANLRVYNLCDDLAAPPEDVIGLAAEMLGLPMPPSVAYEDAEMSAMARSFYAESKRVKNDRVKRELNIDLKYPTYREGLAAMLADERL